MTVPSELGPEEAKAFRDFELEGWEHSAGAYDAGFTTLTTQVGDAMLEILNVSPGTKYADVACGPAHVAARAAKRGADVLGVDFSPAMLALARSRYPGLKLQIGDAESLSLKSDTFDAAGMNFGIPHLGRPDAAVAQMRRIVKKGCRIAFSAWAPPEEARGFKVVLDAVAELGDKSVSLPQGPSFFRFSAVDEGTRICAQAGLKRIDAARIPGVWRFANADEYFHAFLEGTARTGGLLRAQPGERLERIRERVREEALASFAEAGGVLAVPMPAIIYSAEKP